MTKRTCPSEHQEQVQFMQRVEWMLPAHRELIWANPNGGLRDPRTAARLKAEGVKPGVPDITVAVARGPWHGMFIELKRQVKGVVSAEQQRRMRALTEAGYHCIVCRGCDSAWAALNDYLDT